MTLTGVLITIVPIVVIVLLTMILTRIATIALTLTGVSRQSARFQARSALTGAGFTTSESEAMVNHPVRRRIIMMLMLVGSAGIVSVLGTIFISTSRTLGREGSGGASLALTYLLMVVGVAGVLFVLGRPGVDRMLSRLIRRGLRRYTDLDVRDYEALLEIHGSYAISEKLVRAGEWLAGSTLADLRLTDEGVLVLAVTRRNGDYLGAPKGDVELHPGDVVLMYGQQDRIADIDSRPPGYAGQVKHDQAKHDQARIDQEEQRRRERSGEARERDA